MIKLVNTGKQASLLLSAAMFTSVVSAATTITVDSVAQRWPWNNKVDITYTITGGQNLAASEFCKIVFTTVINGTTYTIDGAKDVGASANAGTHTVTWTAPSGVKCASCTMSAAVVESDAPGGDDYMIVDLTKTTDNVRYEGLLATQGASNERYTNAVYKTDKLVLRKVPAGTYHTGDSKNYNNGSNNDYTNTDKDWTTDRAYYIGVFPVTQCQYQKLYGTNPSLKNDATSGANIKEHRPVENVSWNDLRISTTAATSSIPAVASNQGTFFQRLNYITGNKFAFDLPSEVMFEIAERAGADTTYSWGNTMDRNYVVCSENSGSITQSVGLRLPNSLGLYDTAGNVWEWCRDDKKTGDLAAREDAFTPACVSGAAGRRIRGGGGYSDASTINGYRASYRNSNGPSTKGSWLGFRVSMIAE